jgi:hypothetical protein
MTPLASKSFHIVSFYGDSQRCLELATEEDSSPVEL